jgi:hypothetical protein
LVRIHSKFARSPAAAAEFATDAIFPAIRLESYLLASARAHPDRAAALEKLAETTAHTKLTLVHGDVSQKFPAALRSTRSVGGRFAGWGLKGGGVVLRA